MKSRTDVFLEAWSHLLCVCADEEKLTCTFEQGMCFWRQQQDDDGDWFRTRGPTFPALTGPTVDHTLGTSSGGFHLEGIDTDEHCGKDCFPFISLF